MESLGTSTHRYKAPEWTIKHQQELRTNCSNENGSDVAYLLPFLCSSKAEQLEVLSDKISAHLRPGNYFLEYRVTRPTPYF